MVTAQEAHELAEKYADEFFKPPYLKYIGVIGRTPLRNVSSPGDLISRLLNLTLDGRLPTRPNPGDNLEGWCLRVGIKRNLPGDLTLPSEYHGAKVFYYKCGDGKFH